MKKIAFVIVWVGKLPEYYPVWLKSCSYNQTVDFFVFTDDVGKHDVPSNVHVYRMSFEEIRSRFAEHFPFSIRLEKAYKLCDYKPAYGEVFADYLTGFDYWGYCDMDLIWGDIRNFLTEERLETYERIFTRGHCSLFLNNPKVNAYYRTLPEQGCLNFKKVYQSDASWCFDEWAEHCGGGISVIFKKNGIATFDEPLMADLFIQSGKFYVNRRPDLGRVECFYFERGKLYAYGKKNRGKGTEVLYCHFQKRRVKIAEHLGEDCFFFLQPGEITDRGPKQRRIRRQFAVMKCDFMWMLKKVWSWCKKKF